MIADREQVFIYLQFVEWIDMRRIALLLVCVFGLALAGCSGPSDGTGGGPAADLTAAEPPPITTERTPSDGPRGGKTVETARPDATFEGVEMPPGTDRRGIVNSDALARANERLLGGTDFVLEINETTAEWTNGTVEFRRVTRGTIAVSDDVATYQSNYVRLHAEERRVLQREGYIENGTEYSVENETRYDAENGTIQHTENETYRSMSRSVSRLSESTARFTLKGQLDSGHWVPTDTTTVDGRPAIAFIFSPSDDSEMSFGGRMVVDTRGLVHELSYRVDRRDGPERRVVSVTYDLDTPASVDPDPPPWLPAAIDATESADRPAEPTVTTVPE